MFFLRADNPPADHFSIRRRLCLEKVPGCLVLLQQVCVRLSQLGASLFVRINARLVLDPRRERFQPGRSHLFLSSELFGALDIGRAPNAASSPWGEPNLVTDFVNALPNSVDPTETERLIHRVGPCDARLSRILSVKPNPKLSRRRVILLQPAREIRGRSKKLRFQPICFL